MNKISEIMLSILIILIFISHFYLPKVVSSFAILSIIGAAYIFIMSIPFFFITKHLNHERAKNEKPNIFSQIWMISSICIMCFALISICWLQYDIINKSLSGIVLTIEMKAMYLRNYFMMPAFFVMIPYQIKFFKAMNKNTNEKTTEGFAKPTEIVFIRR